MTQQEAIAAFANAHREEIIADWLELVQIPAPSKQEGARAQWAKKAFEEIGLTDIFVDEMGNVLGRHIVSPEAPTLLIAGHMDTVFPMGTELKPRIEEGWLHCPSSGDDTPAVVGLVWLKKALDELKIVPKVNLVLAATVQEEVGLRGAKYVLEQMKPLPDMMIAVDGTFGKVVAGGLGINWVKGYFSTPAGHTLRSLGKPSATKTLGEALTAVYTLQKEQDPPVYLNCGMVGGGTVYNGVCEEAWMTLDMRSPDQWALNTLTEAALAKMKEAADRTGASFRYDMVSEIPAVRLEGAQEIPLIKTVLEVCRELGTGEEISYEGAADSNMGIAAGVPSVCIGMTNSEGAHSEQEKSELDSILVGLRSLVTIVARL